MSQRDSLRELILAADDAQVVPLPIPEWGCTVHLRVLSGADRDRFEESCQEDPKTGRKRLGNFRARFAVLALCDEKGHRLFADADVDLLGKKSAAALSRILEAGMKLNLLTVADVEELEGKSASGQSNDSGTSLPSASASA